MQLPLSIHILLVLSQTMFENRCRENLSITLGDESTKVFVNPDGDRRVATKQLVALLDCIKSGTGEDSFTKELDGAVENARTHTEWRAEYMTLLMRDAEKRAEGLETGLVLYDGLIRYLCTHLNESSEDIAKKFQCKVPDVERARACLDFCKQVS